MKKESFEAYMKCEDPDQPVKLHTLIRTCCTLIPCTVSYDSVNRQQNPRSDCADAQSDLGFCYPNMSQRALFSNEVHIIV